METAAQLISNRVVEANSTDRLASVSARLQGFRSSHCVVVDQDGTQFVGIIRLGDVARWSDPGNRILADLVSKVAPLSVRADEAASQVAQLFEKHELGEAVVFSNDGKYQGLITAESVLKWSALKMRTTDDAIKRGSETLQKMETQLVAQSGVRSAFLAAISHELRTPLNPILLIATDRAENQDLPEAIREDFRMIARNVTAEAKLVEDLLDLTKILSGKVSMNLQPVPIHLLLDKALDEVSSQLRSKKILIEKRWLASDDFVHADGVRLSQVVSNILSNAVKFTPAEGRIAVETSFTDEQSRIAITFHDSGIGMSPEELERIFLPFSPFDAAEVTSIYRPRGLGLGMAIAKSLVELHNGRIEAKSAGRDRGSAITVTLLRSPVASG